LSIRVCSRIFLHPASEIAIAENKVFNIETFLAWTKRGLQYVHGWRCQVPSLIGWCWTYPQILQEGATISFPDK
jgi:hypothetical protein